MLVDRRLAASATLEACALPAAVPRVSPDDARVGVATKLQPFETASHHESFADAGLPAVRLGSPPYAGDHSAQDVPSAVNRDQLARMARTMAASLR